MISCYSRFKPIVVMFALFALLSCTPTARAADVCSIALVDTITLAINGDNICTQKLGNGNPVQAPVFVNIGHCVTYQAGGSSFEVQFVPGSSPFYKFTVAAGQTLNIGPAQGTAGDTYNYYSLSVNGSQCLNGRQLGIVMR